jgi:hypothetical protein
MSRYDANDRMLNGAIFGASDAGPVVLGCTEIALLIHPGDSPLPAFDTTALHADAAVDFILGAGNVSTPAPHASTGNLIPR